MSRKKKPLNDSPARWKSIKKKYGLEKEEYLAILKDQDGRCYICRKLPEECKPRRNLAVDHNHTSGHVRGLLCFNCNHRLLGWYIRDDAAKARRIVKYLTRKVNYGKVPS